MKTQGLQVQFFRMLLIDFVWFSLYSQKFIKLSLSIFFLISHKMCKQMSIKGKKNADIESYILLTRYCNLHISDLAFVSCLACTNGRTLELPVFQARSQVGDSHWQGLLVTEEKLWYTLLFPHKQAEGIHKVGMVPALCSYSVALAGCVFPDYTSEMFVFL